MNDVTTAALLPKWGRASATLLLLATPVLLTPQVFEPYVLGKQTLVELTAVLLLFLWLHDRLSGCRLPSWRCPLDTWALAVVTLTAGSVAWGWRNPGQLDRLRTLWLWILLSYGFVVLLRGGLNAERMQKWLHLPAALVSVVALLQHFGWRGPVPYQVMGPDWRFAIVSTLGNPNFVSGFLGILVPGMLVYGLYRGSWSGFWSWWLPTWGLVLATLLFTFTMGVWWALAAAAVAGAVFVAGRRGLGKPRPWRIVAVGAVTVLVALWAFTANPWNGFPRGGVLDAAQASPKWRGGWGGRIFNWNLALLMVESHPLGGVGFGNFYAVNETYGGLLREELGYVEKAAYHAGVDQPHMLPLELAAETGPAGAFAAWWLPCIVIGVAWRRLRREPDRRLDVLPAALGVVVSTCHGLVSFPMHLPASALMTVWCTAIVIASPSGAMQPIKPRRLLLIPAGVMLMMLAATVMLPFLAQQLTASRGDPRLGAPSEAVSSAVLATVLDPHDEMIWEYLAGYQKRVGDTDGAIASYERALTLVEHLYVRKILRDEYLRLDDLDNAAHHQRAMTGLNPGHIPYWEHLVFLLKETGQPFQEEETRLRELRLREE